MIKMSEEQKVKASSFITLAYRAFIGIAMVILLKTIPLFIYDAAQWQRDIESRTLSSVEVRIDLERHLKVNNRALERLLYNENAIISLQKADSLSILDRSQMRTLLEQIEKNTRK